MRALAMPLPSEIVAVDTEAVHSTILVVTANKIRLDVCPEAVLCECY